MSDRLHPWLKLLCLALAAVLVIQLARLAKAKDPLEAFQDSLLTASAHAHATQPQPESASKSATGSAAGKSAASRTGSAPKPGAVDPEVQKEIDRIVVSEVLGAVPKPLPMGLLGIAGQDAFLRAPNGQTGLVRVGDELGGVKLLQIGTNRVLVEVDGERKELTLFSGFGSESLLRK